MGFAFDGDADRVLACDRNGRLLDGDDLVVLTASHLKRSGRLAGNGVAVTMMSNYGVRAAIAGAEPSGHLIDRNVAPSGDGVAAALLCLEALAGRDLADVVPFARLPQMLRSVPVDGHAKTMAAHPDVRVAVREAEAALTGRGRVLVRPSGTEPLVRVMAEAPSPDEAEAVCAVLAGAVAACA